MTKELSGKPKSREEWRVVIELLRMIKTFTPEQREKLMILGLSIEMK